MRANSFQAKLVHSPYEKAKWNAEVGERLQVKVEESGFRVSYYCVDARGHVAYVEEAANLKLFAASMEDIAYYGIYQGRFTVLFCPVDEA